MSSWANENLRLIHRGLPQCSRDRMLALLCSDAGASGSALSFAPLRAIDLNTN